MLMRMVRMKQVHLADIEMSSYVRPLYSEADVRPITPKWRQTMSSRIPTPLTLCVLAVVTACSGVDSSPSSRLLAAPAANFQAVDNSTATSTMTAPTCSGEVLVFTGTLHTETHATHDD